MWQQTPSNSPDAAWPLILPIIGEPRSAIDFGCGTGLWLSRLKAILPQIEILGLNDQCRKDAGLLLERDQFDLTDITQKLDLDRKFDLGICLEVGEHIPGHTSPTLVESIAHHADTILFSAAIPGQDQSGYHCNEQWPEYWLHLFEKQGFSCFDIVRPKIWENPNIAPWYRQNMMIFMKDPMKPIVTASPDWNGKAIVHPQYFEWAKMPKRRSLGNLVRFILGEPQL